MIRSKIIYRYFAVGTLFLLLFFTLSVFVNYQLNKDGFHHLPDQRPLKKIGEMLDDLTAKERLDFLEESFYSPHMKNIQGPELYLLNSEKEVLFPYDGKTKEIDVGVGNSLNFLSFILPAKNRYLVEKLKGIPVEYLVVKAKHNRFQKQIERRRKKFLIIHGVLLLSMVSVFLSTILFVFYSLRRRVKYVDKVMEDISHGKLESRLPVDRLDEIGFMMERFNQMFDKVEGLVISLRKSEGVRKKLLSELAHDLRTPIASLKNFLEMLMDKRDKITPEKQNRMFEMAILEVDYFSHIVDDLLFIGLIEEPKYQESEEEINIVGMLENELVLLESRFSSIKVVKNIVAVNYDLHANKRLIKRLIRNLLENSLSFAKTEVSISLSKGNDRIQLIIEDDGPGFSKEELESYGQRKHSRQIENRGKRISVGLGSVIIKSIVDTYQGSIVITNILDSNQQLLGAKISITI